MANEIGDMISLEAQAAGGTKEMLYEKLEQSFPEVGSEIRLEIEQKGLVRGAEIDYESCAEFQPVAEKFAKAVVEECEYIKTIMLQAKGSVTELQEQLTAAALRPVRRVYQSEFTQPIISHYLDNWYGEGLREGLQYTVGQVEKNKQKAAEDAKHAQQIEDLIKKAEAAAFAEAENNAGRPKNIIPEQFREKMGSVRVEAGDNVHKLYGEQASQDKLERFLAANPHVAARGVKRDSEGNITHIEIRAGEQVVLPEKLAGTVQQQREAESNKQTTATPKQQSYSLPQPDDTSGAGEFTGKCIAGEKGCGSVFAVLDDDSAY